MACASHPRTRDARFLLPSFTPPTSADHPELFFALVAPAGVDIEAVVNALDAELCAVDYRLRRSKKLAELLHALPPWERLAAGASVHHEDDRIEKHMDAGDDLRRQLDHGAALAALAIELVADHAWRYVTPGRNAPPPRSENARPRLVATPPPH